MRIDLFDIEEKTMELQELKDLLQKSGIVGAGGAGFPTYAKLDERAETILLNCAECEPLLKLHRQLLKEHAYEILKTFSMVADTVRAGSGIIGIKGEYKETIQALRQYIGEFPKLSIKLLDSAYPMGDEVVLIYEATGRVIRPGGLPIEAGVAVFNVETIYNVYRAVEFSAPVTDKVVSVVGEVEHPVSVRVPVGCRIVDVVALAGEVTTKEPVYFIGGPMMGFIGEKDMPVTKTTNAVIVLPKDHQIVQRKKSKASLELKRAASSCCQCETCTSLCPRHALGHPIEPHLFMRSAANQDFQHIEAFLNTSFCSSCGVCEMYACPQGLAPRNLIAECKDGLKKAGVRPPADVKAAPVKKSREYRKVPEMRLEARLGLSRYNVPAPLRDETVSMPNVTVKMSQHIGVPASPAVNVGDMVKTGDVVGMPGNGLSVAVHASIDGKVVAADKNAVTIQRVVQ